MMHWLQSGVLPITVIGVGMLRVYWNWMRIWERVLKYLMLRRMRLGGSRWRIHRRIISCNEGGGSGVAFVCLVDIVVFGVYFSLSKLLGTYLKHSSLKSSQWYGLGPAKHTCGKLRERSKSWERASNGTPHPLMPTLHTTTVYVRECMRRPLVLYECVATCHILLSTPTPWRLFSYLLLLSWLLLQRKAACLSKREKVNMAHLPLNSGKRWSSRKSWSSKTTRKFYQHLIPWWFSTFLFQINFCTHRLCYYLALFPKRLKNLTCRIWCGKSSS